ncbi:hypothetical protein DFP72DRAFT_854206 [Ephemerocybe angulata]|uniref:Uncharacterized protein n=1 Tax=Ephemerocybe angulata TaxID=980116 RepID=A0A8H6LXH5_9AGAR|nr:hypothetical protein DFP72DRAFT_854206 [Tulosesus angulatus]
MKLSVSLILAATLFQNTALAAPQGGTAPVTVTKLIYPAGLPLEYIHFLAVGHAAQPGATKFTCSALGTVTSSSPTTITSSSAIPAVSGVPHAPFDYPPPCGYPGSGSVTFTTPVPAATVTGTSSSVPIIFSTRIVNGTAIPAISSSNPANASGTVTAPSGNPANASGTVTAPGGNPANASGTVTAPQAGNPNATGTVTAPSVPNTTRASSSPPSSSSPATLMSSSPAIPAGTGACVPNYSYIEQYKVTAPQHIYTRAICDLSDTKHLNASLSKLLIRSYGPYLLSGRAWYLWSGRLTVHLHGKPSSRCRPGPIVTTRVDLGPDQRFGRPYPLHIPMYIDQRNRRAQARDHIHLAALDNLPAKRAQQVLVHFVRKQWTTADRSNSRVGQRTCA